MKRMKMLIIGGSSLIGTKLLGNFLQNETNVEFTYHHNSVPFAKGYQLDITQKNATVNLIEKINPDVIIHCAALTNVDLCETNKSLANSINIQGTKNVVEGCKVAQCKIVYVSTSYVFDGKKNQYNEEDVPSPSTYYGSTKLAAEDIIKHSKLPYLIVRTDQPYCWTEKWQHSNSVTRVLQTLRSGKIHKELIDWYNNPTYVPEFVKAVKKLIDLNKIGTFHVVGSDFINRYKWSLITADIFGLDEKMIVPINSKSLNLPAKRSNVNLSNKKLFQQTAIRMMGTKEGLKNMKENQCV